MAPHTKMHRCRKDDLLWQNDEKSYMAISDINPQNWYELAADREMWHAMIK
jgi:hypothetical protein